MRKVSIRYHHFFLRHTKDVEKELNVKFKKCQIIRKNIGGLMIAMQGEKSTQGLEKGENLLLEYEET